MPISSDFIKKLEENARNQNRVVIPTVTPESIQLQERAATVAQFEQEKIRKQQPSYSEARKLYNNETTQNILGDVREKNAFELQQAAKKADPVKLKEDLDGVFGGKNPLTRFLFGSGIKDEQLGKEQGIFSEIGSRGVLGFFTGELLRSTPESEANVYEVLLDTGMSPEEAFKKAKARVAGEDQVLTAEEVSALRTYEKWDTAFKMLDAGFLAIDVATLGTATVVRPLVKSSARKTVAPFIKEAQTMTKRSDLRNLVAKTYPELKGSEELEKMLDIVEEYPANFSLFKARQDFQRTESFNELAKTVSPTPVKTSTEMQRVVYENGIPVLRKTTPSTLVARRAATMDALKGNSENLRLSNADVLQEEIRAGSLPLKTTADDTIEVWRNAPSGRRIKAGEEVSIVEDFAKQLSEGVKPQKIEVAISDLIRLPDGTFTFAPERLIKEAPVLKFPKNIPKQVVKETKRREAQSVAAKLAKKQAEQTAKREAAAKAERELMKPVEEAKKKLKQLEEKPVIVRVKTQSRIAKETQLRVREVADVKKTTIKKVAEINKKLRKAKQEAAIAHVKRMQKLTTKLQKQKEKIRYQNQIAKLNEKAKIEKAKLVSEKNKFIAEIKTKSKARVANIRKEGAKSLKEAQKALRGSRGEVKAILKKTAEPVTKETPENVVEKINKIAKNSLKTSDNGMRDKSLKFLRDNPEEVTKGEVRLREIEDGEIVIEDGRHRLQVASELGITPKIVDVTAEYTGSKSAKIAKLLEGESVTKPVVKKAGKESLKPVGEGAVKESKLYASTQEKVRQIRKDLGENINSKEYEFYRQASNKDQLAKASTYIEENGIEETIKALEIAFRSGGDAVPGVLNNSLMLALEPELLKAGMAKHADKLLRLSSRMATRFGQEIQILSVLDRNNPLVVLHRLQNHLDSLVGDIATEGTVRKGARTQAEKVMSEMVAKIDIKGGAKEAINAIICK